MRWRHLAQSTLIAVATAVQALTCRLLFARQSFEPEGDAPAAAPILVIRCEAKIGDNLLHIPFLRALRQMYPDRPIHLLHHAAARVIYEHCPHIDERIEIGWPMSSPRTLLRRLQLSAAVFRDRPSRERYGVALLPRWDEDLYAPFLAWASGAPQVIGFSRRVLRAKAWRNLGIDLLLTDAVVDRSVQHESRRALQLLARLPGAPPVPPSSQLEFWFSDDDAQAVAALRGDARERDEIWVAVAPGAALDRRKWPIDRFAQVVRELAQWPKMRLMFLGTGAEGADCDALARACGGLSMAGRLDLAQTAAALSTCRLFIGNDSGLLHLACAVRTPVVEISCHPLNTSDLHANAPARFGPTGVRSSVLRPSRPLAPACRNGCVLDTAHCITAVSPAAAIASATALLEIEA